MDELEILYSKYATDPRPLPLIIAEAYGFSLAYAETDEGQAYAVIDWIRGIAQLADNREAGNFWRALQRRVAKATGVELSTRCTQLPYVATNGKTYQMDYANAETLYYVTQRMSAETGLRERALRYLARAGVTLDVMRLDPDGTAQVFEQLGEYKRLIADGWTPEEARQWVERRAAGKDKRKGITGEWAARGVSDGRDYGRLTNEVTEIATGKTATEQRKALELPRHASLRDYLSSVENTALGITEYIAAALHTERDSQGVEDLSDDIQDTRPIINAARPELEKAFGKKRPRRK